jgi:hypothetical protein
MSLKSWFILSCVKMLSFSMHSYFSYKLHFFSQNVKMAILFKTYRNFLLLATESVLVFTSSLCHVHLKCSLFLKRVKRMDIILHCLTIQSSVKSWQADSGLI